MRVAFFSDTYHPSLDGVVRSVDSFSDGLRAARHRVKIFAPAPAQPREREEGVAYAPSISFPAYPQYRIPLHEEGLVREAQAFAPDLIHSHAMVKMGLAARRAAAKTNVPLVGTFHTLVPQAAHYIMPIAHLEGWTGRRMWDYLRWFYGPFDHLLAPSRFLARTLREEGLEAEVLPNPVNTEFFKPGRMKKEKSGPPGAKKSRPQTVLFVGRMAKEKNLDFLLELAALKEWKEWGAQLVLAGDGPYRETLEERAERLRLQSHVRFLGRVADSRLPALYRSASCTIQPSLFETQGLTVLESMACGTPAAVRKGTAMAEVVHPGKSGEQFEDDSLQALEVVRKLCERRAKYAKGSREVAQAHSIPSCTARLLRIYKNVLGS
ncbi:D-inositol-3-phosphate glycosyltransferase [uncultured archaeon]|nr:D-inositol-3-phosphate glycosyltransferase [uncultured archaeon]